MDSYVFPELDKSREGDVLEARFNAFKIPESNFLVFEATVRTCREGCQPAYCNSGTGRSEPSFGRKKRSIAEIGPGNDTARNILEEQDLENDEDDNSTVVTVRSTDILNETKLEKDITKKNETGLDTDNDDIEKDSPEYPEYVREMIEVRFLYFLHLKTIKNSII